MAAKDGVVHEVLRLGLGIGAGVNEDEMTVFPRDDGGERGAGDALHGPQAEGAARHERAGIAAADHDAGMAFLD